MRVNNKVPTYANVGGDGCGSNDFRLRVIDATDNPNQLSGVSPWEAWSSLEMAYQGSAPGSTCYWGGGYNMQFRVICDPYIIPGQVCQAGGSAATTSMILACDAGDCGAFQGGHWKVTFATTMIDPTEPWYSGTGDPPYPPVKLDLWSVIEHEMGHMLGRKDFYGAWQGGTDSECPTYNPPASPYSTMCPVMGSDWNDLDDAPRNPNNPDDITSTEEGY